MTKTTPEQMLDDCVEVSTAQNNPFNEWELKFIDDLEDKMLYLADFKPSEAQIGKLEQIWDKI